MIWRIDDDSARRHERAHCNGWLHERKWPFATIKPLPVKPVPTAWPMPLPPITTALPSQTFAPWPKDPPTATITDVLSKGSKQ